MFSIAKGQEVIGTNPATGRPKKAKGQGTFVRVQTGGYHGATTVIRWDNGVESYHPANLDNSMVVGL